MKKFKKYYFIAVIVLLIILALKTFGKGELTYSGGDDSRHFMNGVFCRDFVSDKAWNISPLKYLKFYYTKYPALSIHRYPPLFYLLEALFISIFGVNILSVNILIFILSLCSLFCWYKFISNKFDPELALISLVFFLSSNVFQANFPQIMLEIPSLCFILIFIYFFDLWEQNKKRIYLNTACSIFAITLLISFKVYFIVLFAILLFTSKAVCAKYDKKICIFAIGMILFCTFLLFFSLGTIAETGKIVYLYGSLRGAEMTSLSYVKELISTNRIYEIISKLKIISTFGIPLCVMSLFGIFYLKKNKNWKTIYSLIFYGLSFYFIYTMCLNRFSPRFNVFGLPVFSFLAAYGTYEILNNYSKKYFYTVISLILIICFGYSLIKQPIYWKGYEKAAKDIISINQKAYPILCDAHFNGNFIAYIRKYDPLKKYTIIRGDKILFSLHYIYIRPESVKKTFVLNEKDIYALLDELGIGYILVDSAKLDIKSKVLLRKVLENADKFNYLKTYTVLSNKNNAASYNLKLYEYLDLKTDYDGEMRIYIPTIKKHYHLNIRKANEFFQELRKRKEFIKK